MIHILIPNYPDPTAGPGVTLTAYGKVTYQQLGSDGQGWVVMTVWRSEEAYMGGAQPLGQHDYRVGGGVIPTLAQMLADDAFRLAYSAILAKLSEWTGSAWPGSEVKADGQ